MKNLFRVLTIAAFFVAFSATEVSAQANPGGVEIIKNGDWYYNTVCGSFQSVSATEQYKGGVLHQVTIFFDVSGSCVQPAPGDGVTNLEVSSPWGLVSISINPAGVAKAKLVVNPNQPTP